MHTDQHESISMQISQYTATGKKTSVVFKDLRLKDEDKDEDLKIGPRGQVLSSRTTTL